MAILREAQGEAIPMTALTTGSHPVSEQVIISLITDGLAIHEGEALRLP